MDLFDYMREQNMEKESPLAARLRPTTLDEVVGQEHIIGKDKLLYRAIKADKLSSILFYGPPGTGKTTLAKVIANTTSAEFLQMNATSAGKKDMEEVVQQAKNNQGMYGKKTILFIDEIHRFNKGQQDYLLPFVEDGTIIHILKSMELYYPVPLFLNCMHWKKKILRSFWCGQLLIRKKEWVHIRQSSMRMHWNSWQM